MTLYKILTLLVLISTTSRYVTTFHLDSEQLKQVCSKYQVSKKAIKTQSFDLSVDQLNRICSWYQTTMDNFKNKYNNIQESNEIKKPVVKNNQYSKTWYTQYQNSDVPEKTNGNSVQTWHKTTVKKNYFNDREENEVMKPGMKNNQNRQTWYTQHQSNDLPLKTMNNNIEYSFRNSKPKPVDKTSPTSGKSKEPSKSKPKNIKTNPIKDNSIKSTNANSKSKPKNDKIDFCGISREHTMCKYSRPGPAATCPGSEHQTLSQAHKDEVLKRHNELRKSLSKGFGTQPIAKTPLPLLKWNTTLEAIAQRWADQCTFEHDKVRNFGKEYSERVGQNIAYRAGTNYKDYDVENLLQGWIDESKMLHPQHVKKLDWSAGGVLHYTQMVWRETTEVGCAGSNYQKNNMNYFQIVCNYYPAGNNIGSAVY